VQKKIFPAIHYAIAVCLTAQAPCVAKGEAVDIGAMKILTSLPQKVNGWQAAKEDKSYNRKNLYDYIDGGAELYLSYNFRSAASRTYVKEGNSDIVVDIFDMGSCADAYGVFSLARETVDSMFGQGSQYEAGLLQFFKDRFYVSVMGYPETPESKKAIFSLAAKITSSIPHNGALPPVVSVLPTDGLIASSVRYFHNHAWLNSHYFIADKDILHIDSSRAAVMATYDKGNKETQPVLVLTEFKSKKAGEEARKSFLKHYMPDSQNKECIKIENNTWVCCRLIGTTVVAVFEAADKKQAAHMLDEVRARLK
jgi:hypothetical protein